MIKKYAFILALVSLTPLTLFAERILLSPHETRYLDVAPEDKVEVSRSDIVQVKDLTTQLMIRAKKRGSVTITVGERIYNINVVSTSSAQGYRKLNKEKYRGLKITAEKDGVMVTGRLVRLTDYQELTQRLGGDWTFAAEVPEDLQESFRAHIQSELKRFGRAPAQLRFHPHPLVLLPAGKLASFRPALRQLGLRHSMSEEILPHRSSMPVTVVFAEIDNKALETFGLQFPAATPFQVLPKHQSPPEVLAQLDHLAGRGLARKYAQPRMQLTSGKSAKFVSGGELPIKSSGFSSSKVEWKTYGLILELKPKFNDDGQLDLEVYLELSGLDPAAGADGIPGIRKKIFASHIFMQDQKPLVIGNFLEMQDTVQVSELPFLRHVPLLGDLFKSKSYLEQKSSAYVLLLPNF